MRLEQLEYLAAVVQHGSLRRASEHLHISQPALSEGVGKLERELGLTLLDRHRSGARINRAGRELLSHMTDVLEAVDRLRAAAGDQNGVTRTVRVGTVNTGTSSVVANASVSCSRWTPDGRSIGQAMTRSDVAPSAITPRPLSSRPATIFH